MKITLKNSKILLAVSLASLSCSILGVAFLYGALGRLAQEASDIKARIIAFDSQLRNFKVSESFIANTENERKVVEESFVNRDNLVKFIEDIERAGKESGVDVHVQSADLAAGPKDSGPSFRLEASGNFSSVFKYSFLLENLPYEISFTEINITKSGDVKEPWNALYVIKLLSYEI